MAGRVSSHSPESWIYFQDDENARRLRCVHAGAPEFYVSISHSGQYVAAAISTKPVGIDVETAARNRNFLAIAAHVFSPEEVSVLENLGHDELRQHFYLLWTLKESLAKQYGQGLKPGLARRETAILTGDHQTASLRSWQCPEYVVSIATEVPGQFETQGLCEGASQKLWENRQR